MTPVHTLCCIALIASVIATPTVHAQDTSHAAMQMRGKIAMGVDQYTSVHKFDDLADGGRVELQRDRDDTSGTHVIRQHLRSIAAAFAKGDFSTPAFVHMRDVPGTKVMQASRAKIRYAVRDLPRGGELRITTTDATALEAVHAFLAFQRSDHRAGGHRCIVPSCSNAWRSNRN